MDVNCAQLESARNGLLFLLANTQKNETIWKWNKISIRINDY